MAPWGGREVIIGGRGLVTLCPDLGHYADSSGSIYGVATAGNEARDKTTPTMQVGSTISVFFEHASDTWYLFSTCRRHARSLV